MMGDVIEVPTFGSRVRDERRGWGWSLQELADAAKLSKSGVWEIEKGRIDPRLSTVMRLADALKVSVAKLVTGEDDGYHRGYRAAQRHMLDSLRPDGEAG